MTGTCTTPRSGPDQTHHDVPGAAPNSHVKHFCRVYRKPNTTISTFAQCTAWYRVSSAVTGLRREQRHRSNWLEAIMVTIANVVPVFICNSSLIVSTISSKNHRLLAHRSKQQCGGSWCLLTFAATSAVCALCSSVLNATTCRLTTSGLICSWGPQNFARGCTLLTVDYSCTMRRARPPSCPTTAFGQLLLA